ncbi:MAG TPA: exodeoxyribonuclease VII large subunit [Candidatus Limnocylindria bacterium]|nr:exodeoxyribonuclease VII large subunit [Candidatus Limnocylindria bacterium]
MSTSSAPERVLRVGQLVTRLAERVQTGDEFKDLWVEGEVVQTTTSSLGHTYFTLRDTAGSLRCVLFATQAQAVTVMPRDGAKLVVHGYVELYLRDGRCQLRVDDVRAAGAGEAALRLEALRRRLEAEGLFRPERKRPLPAHPRRIGVVTSPTGAAWHDIQTVVARRDPRVELVFAGALVQGTSAVESLIAAFDGLARVRGLDAVILARGGGAPEDLWPFNDEALVRAIARFPVPVCTGVGHESDTTLVDHVADVRAPTPSVAAELVIPDATAEVRIAQRHRQRIDARMHAAIESRRRRLLAAGRLLERRAPAARVAAFRQRLDEDRRTLDRAVARLVPHRRQRAASARRRLEALSPLAVLGRGYAIVEGGDGRVRADARSLRAGEDVRLRMRDGRAGARVTEAP